MKRIVFSGICAAVGVLAAADFHMTASSVTAELDKPSFQAGYVVHGAGWKQCGRLKGLGTNRATPPPADGKYPFSAVLDNGPALEGLATATTRDGAVRLAYRGKVVTGGVVETVSVQGYVDKADFAGGRVIYGDNRSQVLPQTVAQVELGRVSSFRVESGNGTRYLDFTFERPVLASILSKSDSDRYTLRLSAVRHTELKVGDACDVAFTLRTQEPIVDLNSPWTATSGTRFVTLDYKPDIVPGSALDFTGLVPRVPCGTYGRLRAKGGHFEFDNLPGVPQKFFGMNLHSFACYHTMEEARKLVDLFVRCGYNAVRFHNYENEYMGLTMGSPDEATPVEARFEGLDNLVEACRARGLYVTIDLHIGRRTSYRAIGIDKPGMVVNSEGMKGEMKYQYLTNPKARENFKRFIRGFFEHVNPHTGRRYADEPTLALVSVVNESPCCWHRYGGNKTDFCAEEYELMREMSAFIRDELKSQVPLTTCNGGAMPFCLQPMRQDFCDYVDDHFYYDHPAWAPNAKVRRGDRVPLFTRNQRYVAESQEIRPQSLMTRLWGKPYVITEFNWCAPSLYRGSAGLVVGSIAGAQDWDGLWRYLWAHDHARALESGKHEIAKLESASDALALAADRAAMCLFLRGDMKPLSRKAAVVIKRVEMDVKRPHRCVWESELKWPWAGWYAQLGTAMGKGPEGSAKDFAFPKDLKLPREEVLSALGADSAVPAEGAVAFDRPNNGFTVTTSRTCGGSVEKGAFTAGPLAADCGDQITTLWASSLDGKNLSKSSRILLTHLTRLYNTGDKFADRDGRYLLQSGRAPYLMPRATAKIRLMVEKPEQLKVYALDSMGARRGEVPVRVEKDQIVFTCETFRDASNATFLYELAR